MHYFKAKFRATIATCLILSATLLSSGCNTWFGNDFNTPDVQLVDVELVYARLLEQEFALQLRIDNPNAHSLPVRGLNYTVHLNGILLGKGQSTHWKTIPANSHAYITLPVHTNLWRHVKGVLNMLEQPNQPITYALDAELRTGLTFNKKVPVRHRGSFTPGQYLRD